MIQVFVHVSTVFNNLDKGEIDEVIYPASMDPQKLMDFVDCMDNELLASITKQYITSTCTIYKTDIVLMLKHAVYK